MALPTQRIGALLIEAGAITSDQLQMALRQQDTAGGRLGTNLVELGFTDEKTIAQVLARQLSIPSASAAQLERIPQSVLALVPAPLAERVRAVPLREDAGRLWVAMAEPTNKGAIDELGRAARRPVRPMVAPELLIQHALERHYHAARKPRIVSLRALPDNLLTLPSARREEPIAPVWDSHPPAGAPPPPDGIGNLDELREPAASPTEAPRIGLAQIAAQLASAPNDTAIFEIAMRFVAQECDRVALLLLRDGVLRGWRGLGIDTDALKATSVPLEEVPLLARTIATGALQLGQLRQSDVGRFALPVRLTGETLGVVVAVHMGKRPVGCMLGVHATLEALRHRDELERLGTKLDQALHISYLRRLLLSD
jgi:hypothetical protein